MNLSIGAIYTMKDVAKDDWENLYLLGYYDRHGHPYLTTWIDGDPPLPKVYVVVLSNKMDIPLWSSPVGKNIRYIEIDSTHQIDNLLQLADKLGGYLAFGWKIIVPDRLISCVLDT